MSKATSAIDLNANERAFFITIHKEAKCWDTFQAHLEEVEAKGLAKWAYILHDKDANKETGELKPEHWHVYIEYKNAHTIAGMIGKRGEWVGAHVEIALNKCKSFQYLTHSNRKAKEEGKYQYPANARIQSANIDASKYETDEKEPFKEELIPHYIAQGIKSSLAFIQTFGIEAYNRYSRAYLAVVKEYALGDDYTTLEVKKARQDLSEDKDEDLPF